MGRLISKMINKTDFDNALSALVEYYKKFGSLKNIELTDTYKYKGDLIYIGAFVDMLKTRCQSGLLDNNIAEHLTRMGLEYCNYSRLAPLIAYYNEFGTINNINILDMYKYQGKDMKIGSLIKSLRQGYKNGKLTQEEIELLNSMGMVWCATKTFEERITPVVAYYNEFGTIANIKQSDIYKYQGKDMKIGSLINNLRQDYKNGKLTQEELDLLNSMGMVWRVLEFDDRMAPLIAYYNEFGTIANIKQKDVYNYEGKSIKIGNLIALLRQQYKKGLLNEDTIKLLNNMGMSWSYDRMEPLRAYYNEFGTISSINASAVYYFAGKEIKIGSLISTLRTEYRKGKLTPAEINELELMGMVWKVRERFKDKLKPLIAYYNEFGTINNINILDIYKYQGKDINIGVLISNLRRPERKTNLTKEEIELLNSMGMVWDGSFRNGSSNEQEKNGDNDLNI